MTNLTPRLAGEFTAQIEQMKPLDFWARVHPDIDTVRFCAHRRRDASWHLTLEDWNATQDEHAKEGVWYPIATDWKRAENPSPDGKYYWDATALCELFVLPGGDVVQAVDDLFSMAMDAEIEDDSHPGAAFLYWVWRAS